MYTLATLLRNLRAGARLAFFLPVARVAFRIELPQLLLLFALSAAIDVVGDYLRIEEPRVLSLFGAGSELYAAALLLLSAAIVALLNRQRALALALPVIAMASLVITQALHYALIIWGVVAVGAGATAVLENVIIVWIVLILVRSVAVAFAPPPMHQWLRAIGGGLLLASPLWFANTLYPNEPWWREPQEPVAQGGMNAGSEAVLAAQTFLLDRAIENLHDERPGITDLYFVGFAPYGRQDVFRKDVEAAQRVMDTRWGTDGRSLLLLNHPETLITAPFATVTNLREALNDIGSSIDAEDDVVMLYLASHGSADHRLAAVQPPLSLVELTPSGLKQLLDDSGIKWRIIVVSACFSGGYIPVLADDHTLIVTASQADRVSFGCDDRSDATFFGEALFQQGLARSDGFDTAFEIAKKRVAEREAAQGYSPPSNPQISIGSAMADKLKTLRKRGAAGATAVRAAPPRHG